MPESPYHVRLAVSQQADRIRAELFTEDLGDTNGDVVEARLEKWQQFSGVFAQGAGSLLSDQARDIGHELFLHTLGTKENSRKWSEVLTLARQQGRRVRLMVDATADEVRDLPYGLLCDMDDDYYLARSGPPSEEVSLVRMVRRCPPRSLSLRKPLKILVAVAEPKVRDIPSFGGAEHLRMLLEQLEGCAELWVPSATGPQRLMRLPGGAPDYAPFTGTTFSQLRRALKEGDFDILHIMAHGAEARLLFCKEDGTPDWVEGTDIGKACLGRQVQLAFLQACRAGQVDGRGGFGGVAQQLLNPKCGDLSAVIASAYPLDADECTPVAVAFYRRLAGGDSPDLALDRSEPRESQWIWALLDLWVRPLALSGGDAKATFQFGGPYRGLARFRSDDADIFFGREAELAELLRTVQDESIVELAGDSGSGKSSLLGAGLVATVQRQGLGSRQAWRVVALSPGQEPARTLAAALRQSGDEPPAPKASTEWLDLLLSLLDTCSRSGPLLIVLDQFEEIVTLCRDPAQRDAVATALYRHSRQHPDIFRVVLGLRSEYLTRVAALPGIREIRPRPLVLGPPDEECIRKIVAQPAEHHGYVFEGPVADGNPEHAQGLLERILCDPLLLGSRPADGSARLEKAASTPLPLLEFALERLWLKAFGREARVFTHADYDEMGGVSGAIGRHAEDVYARLSTMPQLGGQAQELARWLFKELVTAENTRRPRTRPSLCAAAKDAQTVSALIDHLVAERLLTIRSSRDSLAESQVEITHEVIIASWDRLRNWLERLDRADMKSIRDVDLEALAQRRLTPSPDAWEDEVIYHVLIDRFSDGQERCFRDQADALCETGHTRPVTDDDISKTRADRGPRPHSQNWTGGTLAGLRSKLGYLKRLGITCLRLSPPFRQVAASGSYHGYGPQDFLAIDPHFGSRQELRALVQEAHGLGIRVLLEFVLHHAGDVFAYQPDSECQVPPRPVLGYRDSSGQARACSDLSTMWPGGAVWPVELQDLDNFCRQGSIRDWKNAQEQAESDFYDFKTFRLGTSEGSDWAPSPTLRTLTSIAKFWLAYADLDGMFVDVAHHINRRALKYFCKKVRDFAQTVGKDDFIIIGEHLHESGLKGLGGSGLEAAWGLTGLREGLRGIAKGTYDPAAFFELSRRLSAMYESDLAWYRRRLVTCLDDHDQAGSPLPARFCHWDIDDRHCQALLLNALAFQLYTLGIPSLYYGTEQGFDGWGAQDIAVRECMFGGPFGAFGLDAHCFVEDRQLFRDVAALLRVRKEHVALRRGPQFERPISVDGLNFMEPCQGDPFGGKLVAWSRLFNNSEVLIVINNHVERDLQAWVTVDNQLHDREEKLICFHSSAQRVLNTTVAVEERNGKAVRLTVPAASLMLLTSHVV